MISNSPQSETSLRLEARKSFTLGALITDSHGKPLDLTKSQLRFIVKDPNWDDSDVSDTDDSDKLVFNSVALPIAPAKGYVRFSVQANDLHFSPGEYPYAIVLVDSGYSAVVVKGTLELVQNTEYSSVNDVYYNEEAVTDLAIKIRDRLVVRVSTGSVLAPGTTSFSDADKTKLDNLQPGAEPNVVPDWSASHDEPGWIRNKPSFTQDGEAIPGVMSVNGMTGHIEFTVDSLLPGELNVFMTAQEREKLQGLEPYTPPTFGDIITRDASEFRPAGNIPASEIEGVLGVSQVPGLDDLLPYGTAVPTGGNNGDFYFQYTV